MGSKSENYSDFEKNVSPQMPSFVHLITGFRQTGKDTLHYNLKSGHIRYVPMETPMWSHLQISNRQIAWVVAIVYAICNIIYEFFGGSMPHRQYIVMGNSRFRGSIYEIQDRDRVAQADPLKDEVHQLLNLSPDSDFEALKDTQIESTGMTLREWYIKYATEKRSDDPDYWAALALEKIKDSPATIVDATDFRFPNEHDVAFEHCCTTSTRIYRHSVPIPPPEEVTEHGLADFETDGLLIPSWFDYMCAIWRFPSYAAHIYMGDLVTTN